MDPFALIMLVLLPVLLIGSAFFSGSETALFSLSRNQRAQLARRGGMAGGLINRLLGETRGLLITLLLGNMTINVLFFVISSMLLLRLRRSGLSGPAVVAAASVAPLLAIILLGEVFPKLVAARMTVRWARLAVLPLYAVHRLIAPVRVVAQVAIITPLARLIAPPERPSALSSEELESLLKLSVHHGVIDMGEEQMLEQVLELGQLKVRDLMVPRVDIQAFDLQDDPAELMRMLRETQLSHVPIYRDSLDHIVGLIYARQALLRPPQTRQAVRKLVRSVRFVPELQRADRLLVDLRKTGTTFAIVVDEYGGTAGLITIEDVVEHMVGDIAGGYEREGEPTLEEVRPGVWRVGAELAVHEWADMFGHDPTIEGLPELEAVTSVGGLVMARLGRVPSEGDHTTVGNVKIIIDRMRGRRIDTVLIKLLREPTPTPDAGKEGGA